MVRAMLRAASPKTQTRRLVKAPFPVGMRVPGPAYTTAGLVHGDVVLTGPDADAKIATCPYGGPGARLWVRETHAIVPATAYRASREDDGSMVPHRVSPDGHEWAVFRAGWSRVAPSWKPSIHMPRWASRLTLDVTGVRVERLQDITEEDAKAEGVERDTEPCAHGGRTCAESRCMGQTYRAGFCQLWCRLYGPDSWDANPWVWVVEFKRAEVSHG